MNGKSASVGRIVFLTLLCMSLGTAAIGFVAIYGFQSLRTEFDRLIGTDLPQTTIAIRLNAEISALTSQVGLLITAKSEVELDTIQIQTQDQLQAINRQKELLSGFDLPPDELADIKETLDELIDNLDALSALGARRIQARETFQDAKVRAKLIEGDMEKSLNFNTWISAVEETSRLHQLDKLKQNLLTQFANIEVQKLGHEILNSRRFLLEIEQIGQGRLKQHTLLSSRLTDSTRFMSSRLISDASMRGSLIQNMTQSNLYIILACFLGFLIVGAFIYIYLDKHVVARIQILTRKMNLHDGLQVVDAGTSNEIMQLETSFAHLTDTIAERENRLVALNEAAKEAQQIAEKATESKSKLLAAASHDLRQPVHAMGLLLGGIKRDELNAQTQKTLKHLDVLTKETIDLFNSILDLSKLEAGAFTATNTPINLRGLFQRIQKEWTARAAQGGAQLSVLLPEKMTFVSADEDALYRILSNLIGNAIEHVGKGEILVSSQIVNGECAITIADEGPGIKLSQDTAGDRSQTSAHSGYGLGLSISFALAKAMNSVLTHRSPKSGGTEFSLTLETCAPVQFDNTHSDSIGRLPKSLENLQVVLLEDNIAVRQSTHEGLAHLGCNVLSFSDAQSAQNAIISQKEPFVLISDVNLGRGYSATGLIDEVLASMPNVLGVIVTTATRIDESDILRKHADIHFLEKPFPIARLASLLRFMSTKP